MKQAFYFFMICLYALGVIGGVGCSIYAGAWPVAAGVVALAYMAWPKLVEYFNALTKG